MSIEDEIRDAVDTAKSKKNFNIINVLNERAYPKDEVSVSLDESTAYRAALVKEEIDELERKLNSKNPTGEQKEKLDKLTEELESLTEEMMKSSYKFFIQGISEGRREELAREAKKKYPIEYEKPDDIASLVGGSSERKEKPSEERDNLFTDLIWKEHIVKIEDPDGNIQDTISYNDVKALRTNLPLSAMAKINTSIEKLRTATAVFMMETGEDFLAKP